MRIYRCLTVPALTALIAAGLPLTAQAATGPGARTAALTAQASRSDPTPRQGTGRYTPPVSGPALQPAVVGDLGTAPATAAPAATTASVPAFAGADPEIDAARGKAKATGQRVHVAARDTETDTTTANPDGTLTVSRSLGASRVRKGAGLVPVDPTLQAGPAGPAGTAGTVSPTATNGNLRLSGGGAGALAQLDTPAGALAYTWPTALPAPQLAGDTATYPAGAAPGTDLRVKATPQGFESFVVLSKRPTSPVSYHLALNTAGLTATQAPGGNLTFTDPTGARVAYGPAPRMWGAAKDVRADEFTQQGPVVSALRETGPGSYQLDLTPDWAFLNDPATTYPVTIDPSTRLGEDLDSYVSSAYPTTNYDNDPLLKVGTYDGGATVDRSFLRFNDGIIKGKLVQSATLSVYENWSYACSPSSIYAEGAPAYGGGTTWNTQVRLDGTVWGNQSFYGGYSGCPSTAGYKTIPITGLVNAWAHNGSPAPETLALIAPNETDSYQWKKFASNSTSTPPVIDTTYATAPATPAVTAAASGDRNVNASWPAPYDGGSGITSYQVDYYRAGAGTPEVAHNISGSLTHDSSGCCLAAGASYTVKVYARNAAGNSPTGTSNAVTVAASAPVITKLVSPHGANTYAATAQSIAGQLMDYRIQLSVPGSATAQTVTVTDPLGNGLLSPAGLSVGATACAKTAPAGTATCTVNPPGAANAGLTATVPVPQGSTQTLTYSAVAPTPTTGLCNTVANTAKAALAVAGAATSTATASLTVCDSRLGLEQWWSYLQRAIGPQGTAEVNVNNGNLVVQQVDSTQIQAHGHLAYVLRRTYNSQDQGVAALPGGIGAGWNLNFGEAGEGVGDGITSTGLSVPGVGALAEPLAVTMVDRDGTHHLFTPRATTPFDVTAVLGDATSNLGTRVLSTVTMPTGYTKVCLDTAYQAPAGVHLGLWRYLAVKGGSSATPCTAAAIATEAPLALGFVSERPDRLRSEYSFDGRLLDQIDGAGVEMRYAYTLAQPALGVALGQLQSVYEPRSCTLAQVQAAGSTCRALRFGYASATSPITSITDPAGRVTTYGYDTPPAGQPPHLISVGNPDGSALHYTYAGVNGAADCGSGSVHQLCSATDPRNTAVGFGYTAQANGLPRLSSLVDRRGTTTTVAYAADGASTTATRGGTQLATYSGIDTRGRAARLQDADNAGTLFHDSRFTWDAPGATCRQPDAAVDNLLCATTRVQTSALPGAAPAQSTAYRYNNDGLTVSSARTNPAGGSDTTTTGYHAQYIGTGSTRTYDDTPTGGGAVSSGGARINQPAGNLTLYSLDDRTALLGARGNAAGAAYPGYQTSWTVDDGNSSGSPSANTPQTGGFCAAGKATGNSGLVCQQDTPSSAAAPASSDGKHDLTQYTYDPYGQKSTMRTPAAVAAGNAAAYSYAYYADSDNDLSGGTNAGGWLKTVTDPLGAFVAYGYDRAGNTARTWDRTATAGSNPASYPQPTCDDATGAYPCTRTLHGGPTTALSAPWRYVLSVKDPVGNITGTAVDANGNPTALTPPRGTAAGNASYDTTAVYDGNDQVIRRHTPAEAAGADATWVYDPFGNLIVTTSPRGPVTTTTTNYDAVNRPLTNSWTRGPFNGPYPTAGGSAPDCNPGRATTNADSPLLAGRILCQATTAHDGLDQITGSQDAAGASTTNSYDSLGRRTASQLPADTVNPDGSNGPARTTQTGYDADGHPTEMCPPREFDTAHGGTGACTATSPFSTHDGYDPAGRAVTHTTYRQHTDPTGTYPNPASYDPHTSRTGYDPDGNPVSSTDPRGNTTTTAFDLLDRKTRMSVPRGPGSSNDTTWAYDPTGDVTATTAPPGDGAQPRVTASTFDADHRVVDTVAGADNTNAAATGASSADGGSNTRTRTFYDADGHTAAVLDPRAFSGRTASAAPDTDYLRRTDFDLDGRPTDSYRARTDSASPVTDPALSPTQGADCTTGNTPAALPGIPAFPSTAGVCHTKIGYDPNGNKTQLTYPTSKPGDGRNSTYGYTDDNLLASSNDPSPDGTGRAVTTTVLDGRGKALLTTPPVGAENLSRAVATAYFDDGTKRTQTLPGNGSTGNPTASWAYDPDGHPISTTRTGSPSETTSTAYLSDGLRQDAVDGAGDDTRYGYDANGNPTAVSSPAAVAKDASNPNGTPTTNAYTADNLLASALVPVSTDGTTLRRTDYTYDPGGRTTGSHTYEVASTSDTVPVAGRDAGNQSKSFYPNDRVQTQTGRTAPDLTPGALPGATTASTITTAYDPAGNPLTITDSSAGGSTLTGTYYLDGLLRTHDDGSRTTLASYDGLGQRTARQDKVDGTGTTNTTRYDYNDAGKPTTMTSDVVGGAQTTMTYDPAGRPRLTTMPNGTTRTASYNPDDTVHSAALTATGNTTTPPLASWTYAYDQLQRVTSQNLDGQAAPATPTTPAGSANTGAAAYQYDTADRLSGYTPQPGGGAAKTIAYDHNGNRTSYGPQAFTYNADDTIATATALTGGTPKAATYTAFGGLASDSCTTYGYDSFDRTASSTPTVSPTCGPGTTGVNTYAYDGLDRQRNQTNTVKTGPTPAGVPVTEHFDGASSNIATQSTAGLGDTNYELDPAGTAMAVTGPAPDATAPDAAGGTVSQYLTDDGQGTITTAVSANATNPQVDCTARFDPYGTALNGLSSTACSSGSTPNQRFYRGARRDPSTGQYQMGARTYDPNRASFLTADNYRTGSGNQNLGLGTDPLTRNTYSYVNGNPVNSIDPDGHRTEDQYYGKSASSNRENQTCDATCMNASQQASSDPGFGGSSGGGSSGGGDWGGGGHNTYSNLHNIGGGFGKGAYQAGPGTIGTILGWLPWKPAQEASHAIDQGQHYLQDWYGVDEGSAFFKISNIATQVVVSVADIGGAVVGGIKLVKGAVNLVRAAQAVRATRAVGTIARAAKDASSAADTSAAVAGDGLSAAAPAAETGAKAAAHSAASAAGTGGRAAAHTAPAAAKDGMAGVRAAGSFGERSAGVIKNTDHIPSLSDTAAYRIPDELNATTLGEVKNVGSLSYTNQLRDFSAYAQQEGLTFNLYVRGSTTFSGPLQEAIDEGLINVDRRLPG